MNDIEIIDNFLEPSVFENLKNQMYSQQMVWSHGRMLSSEHCEILCDELDNSLMYHIMYESESSLFNFVDISDLPPDLPNLFQKSNFFDWMKPILDNNLLNIKFLLRIKANLYLRTKERIVHGYHTDYPFKCKSAIYYVNSNDGSTKFKNGQEIESVENRMIIFDGALKHTGTTCTNKKIRMCINFNYF